jgi:hypothetical protein
MPTALLVGVDTEADDQWSLEGRRRRDVRNAERLFELQALFDRFGVRPSYLVTYEMASREPAASILRELARSGRCEIGAHLHPWSSPPYREEDLAGAYPSQLPTPLLERQLRELSELIQARLGVRPISYRAGRHGLDERALPLLESLGYEADSSVDPLFNERRKGGPCFAGAPSHPYHPDYADLRRRGSARLLEIPVSSATRPRLPKTVERWYTCLPPLRARAALGRLGLRPVWLRPSYTRSQRALGFARRLVAEGRPCLNLAFHSSEVYPGGSPYNPDPASVERFLDDLKRLFEFVTQTLGATGQTYAEFARSWGLRSQRGVGSTRE